MYPHYHIISRVNEHRSLYSLFVWEQEVGNVGDLRGIMIFRGREGLKNRLVCNWFSVKVKGGSGWQSETQHSSSPPQISM